MKFKVICCDPEHALDACRVADGMIVDEAVVHGEGCMCVNEPILEPGDPEPYLASFNPGGLTPGTHPNCRCTITRIVPPMRYTFDGWKWYFEKRDAWVGVYWNKEGPTYDGGWGGRLDVYICLIPFFPLRLRWWIDDERGAEVRRENS